MTLPYSQVVDSTLSAALQAPEGKDVRSGQIAYMDVVTDACPIGRIMVRSVDRQLLPPAQCHIQDDGDQVGLRSMAFTQLAIRVAPRRIE